MTELLSVPLLVPTSPRPLREVEELKLAAHSLGEPRRGFSASPLGLCAAQVNLLTGTCTGVGQRGDLEPWIQMAFVLARAGQPSSGWP